MPPSRSPENTPNGEKEAQRFLERHLGRAVDGVEWVGEGAWSRCFGFRDDGREYVIRFGRFLEDFEKDRRAASFRSAALPVPQVSDVGPAFDAWFAISTRVRGEPLESLDAAGWRAVLPALFAALDAARSVPLPDAPGYGTAGASPSGYGCWDAQGRAPYASWRDFLLAVEADPPDRRTHGWRQRLIDSPIGDRSFRAGLARLAELADAAPPGRSLVHADLINRNVLVAGARLTGVFDWGCSLYGDFLYDLAWLEFWSPWYEALAALDLRSEALAHFEATGLPVPDFEARLRACMIHIGLAHQAYHAHTGILAELTATTERLLPLLD